MNSDKEGVVEIKKVGVIIFDMILFISICLLSISFSIEKMVVKTITEDAVGDAVSHRVMDIVFEEFPQMSSDDLLTIQNAIADSPSIETMTAKYIENITESIASGDMNYHHVEIGNDIKTLIDENMYIIEKNIGYEISQTQKEQIEEKIEDKAGDIQEVLSNVSYNLLSSNYENDIHSKVIKTYQTISDLNFQIICGVVIVISLAIIFLLLKSIVNTSLHVGIDILCSGFFLAFLLPIIANQIGSAFTNRFLGRAMSINCSSIRNIGLVLFIIGIILSLIYYLNRKSIKKTINSIK